MGATETMPEIAISTTAARVLDALVALDILSEEQLAQARTRSADDGAAGRLLFSEGVVTEGHVVAALEKGLGYPRVDLTSYTPDDEALLLMPADVARAYHMLPLFDIDGVLTVALGGPMSVFSLDDIGEKLGIGIDAVLGERDAIAAALDRFYGDASAAAPESAAELTELDESTVGSAEPEPLPEPASVGEADANAATEPGAPAPTVADVMEAEIEGKATVDLDVLAVADDRIVAVLVTDILEAAVRRGASRIHLLPYKSDFFLVFRVDGRLEKVASAPVSMQGQLVDGFKNFARLGDVSANRPALGRMRAELAGKTVNLTISAVPTVAGQRLVVTIAPDAPAPRDLAELGMSDAETRALHAMVERGRGLLLLSSPVGGGSSATYYALLQHAAKVGKTVYSVERSIGYEIPAVAQVLVSPGQPIDSAGYFSAGLQQDTDVLAIDSIQTVNDAHLAIEAAGMGKLVIATFAAGDVVSAVRRLLDLGAEPVSLADALTLGVGQRTLRTNCPECAGPAKRTPLAKVPGADFISEPLEGKGCDRCSQTGFEGSTGVFEVLPFTEPVRAVIAHGGTAEKIGTAAAKSGMRTMLASGLSKVADGSVSPEELDRALRFSR